MSPSLIRATYLLRNGSIPIDLEKKARALVLGQTTDTWTPNARSAQAKLKKHTGHVISTRVISSTPDFIGEVVLGFPRANFERDIPSLLTMIFGKISMDGAIRLSHLELPPGALSTRGPQFGIDGIRHLVSEKKKPLTMAIFKPCIGLTPLELGDMFYELAAGGLHLVKDDEILPDLSICPTEKRLEVCLEAGARARKQNGSTTLYAINLTGPVSQLVAKARRLKKLGAQCFLFNVLSYGFGALQELSEVGVPIMAHPALAGALCGSQDTGISYATVLGTLMRAGGADIVLFPSSYGTVRLPEEDTSAIGKELTRPLKGLTPSFPVPSAGIHPGLVPKIIRDFGHDVIVNAGGAVSGHPGGLRAGALAFRQAVDWTLSHADFSSLPGEEMPELATALSLWNK